MKKHLHLLRALLVCAIMFQVSNVQAVNWFVKGGTNTNTTGGTTWATAVTITKAASSAAAGDVIYVAAGDYTQTASITLGKGFTVIGGYAGTEDEATISTALSNPTVNVARFTQAATSLFRIFAIGSSTLTGTITLQGLTFDALNNSQNGLALECSSSSVLTTVIKNCVFKNFTATGTTVAGAINVNNVSADVTIRNCWFENITSGNNGGAMSVNAKVGNTISIIGCTYKTTATPVVSTVYNGGAIYANSAGYTLKIDSCNFENTKASTGGAIYLGQQLTANITNSTFKGCFTAHPTAGSGHGGAIISQAPTVNITSCKFDGCSDNGRGLIYWNIATTTTNIKKSIFINNTSGGTTQNSGAVFGVQNGTSTVVIDSCYAYNNTSTANSSSMCSSVLYSATGGSNITIRNSVFVKNIGKAVNNRAIQYNTGATLPDALTITNSIIMGNTNLATNDTIRDVSSPGSSNTINFHTSLLGNGYVASGDNTFRFAPHYTTYLNETEFTSMTSKTALNDVIAAANVLLTLHATGIKEVTSASSLSIVQGDVLIKDHVGDIDIYNVQGLLVKSAVSVDGLDLSSLPHGIYLVVARIEGKTYQTKFIK